MEDLTLQHHGVKGQKWGIRRFQNKSGGLTPLGRLRRKRYEKELAKKRIENLEKAREARKTKKEHEVEKQKALNSGSAKEVLKYKGELTNLELQNAINRINLERQLTELNSREVKTGLDKVSSIMNKVDQARSATEKGISAYNTVAKVTNSLGLADLPVIDGSTKKNKIQEKARKKLIESGTPEEISKRFGSYSVKELEEITKRMNYEDQIKKRMGNTSKDDKSDSTTKTADSKSTNSDAKSSGPKVDFDKVKSAADTASKAYDAYKDFKKSKGSDSVTGEVIGEGTSKSKSESTKKSKPAGYYDPIDMEEPVSSAKNSESASIGKDYVTLLLEDKSK